MAAAGVLNALLASAIGLLLGSVLPADLLARRRGIDIRSVGDGNPGTVNAVRGLGWAPGLITLAYDALVGIAAIGIALLLGVSEGQAYLAGIMTVVGHRFPVFTGFRGGGQGMAASAGMLVYGIGVALSRGWLSAVGLGVLVATLLVTFVVTRSDEVAAIVMLPVLVVMLLAGRADRQFLAFMTAIAAYMWVVQVGAVWGHSRAWRVRPTGGQTRGLRR